MTHANRLDQLRLDEDGAELFRRALSAVALRSVTAALGDQPSDHAGVRLFGADALRPLLCASGPLGSLAAARMKGTPRPVRAVLFDKTATMNWSLPWHQDRVIAVRERMEVEGFGPWSRKHG